MLPSLKEAISTQLDSDSLTALLRTKWVNESAMSELHGVSVIVLWKKLMLKYAFHKIPCLLVCAPLPPSVFLFFPLPRSLRPANKLEIWEDLKIISESAGPKLPGCPCVVIVIVFAPSWLSLTMRLCLQASHAPWYPCTAHACWSSCWGSSSTSSEATCTWITAALLGTRR